MVLPYIILLDLLVAVIFLIFSIKEKLKNVQNYDMFIASMGILSTISLYSISKVI